MKKKLLCLCMTALLSVVSTTAWALSQVNGFYQIGSAEDFRAFAELVNAGNVNINALLTADIDKGTDGTKIGKNGLNYQGVFDGAGHTISINLSDGTDGEGPAIFHSVGNHAIIKKLKVQGTIVTGLYKHTAAIANYSSGIIRDCFADVNITSNFTDDDDASIGAIVGQLNKTATIENCLAKIKITGATTHKCGGLAAWADNSNTNPTFINIANCLVINDPESNFKWSDGKSAGLVRNDEYLNVIDLETYNADSYNNRPKGACANNYVTNNWGVTNKGTTVVTSEELLSGKICYQLNSDQSQIRWVQNIGDPYPVPAVFGANKGQVYASVATNCQGKASGEVTFSNSGSDTATKHTYDKYGVCTTCGQFNFNCFDFDDPTRFDATDKAVLLGSAADLYLAEGWNRLHNGFKINMKMVNDIECTPPTGQLIFNSNDWIDGNFNGGGHVLTIELVDVGFRASFMPEHCGIFENVIMHGSISTTGTGATNVGCISGEGRQSLVRNVYSDVTITSSVNGDNSSGGFFGKMIYSKTVENCIYAGDFITPRTDLTSGCVRIGGFAGWANDATTFKNCAFLGHLVGAGCANDTQTAGTENSYNISRNPGKITCENVYVANPITSKYVKDDEINKNKFTIYTNTDGIANGELAYFLNGKQSGLDRFYQLIGTDAKPMPIAKEGGLVYAVTANYLCDGTPLGNDVTYSNTSSGTIPDHVFVDGVCRNCGDIVTDADGYKKIINAQTLTAFTVLVNTRGKTGLKARMYADVDMSGITDYYPIGTETYLYVGEFDGQGHAISNLVINNGGYDYQGLFGRIGNGADIKNLVLDNTCSITGQSYVGVIGGTNGSGKVYITNVGNEGFVTGTGANASGIIGVDMGGTIDMFITNCYVTGAVSGNRESATICSWSSTNSIVKNCYSTATLQGKYGDTNSFTRGYTSVVNCYEIVGVGTQNNNGKDKTNIITSEEVVSGKLCFILNGDQSEIAWYQTLNADTHPVPFSSHAQVYETGTLRCDGAEFEDNPLTYTNTESHPIQNDHQYNDEGFCTVCGQADPDAVEKNANGYYLIGTAKQLNWFARKIEKGETTSKALLTADIDLSTSDYPNLMIGTADHKFAGIFNGAGYTITYHYANVTSSHQGLFRAVDGATIRNLNVEGSAVSTNIHFGALIGRADGTVLVEKVVTNVNITGQRSGVTGDAGMVGANYANITFNNCATLGEMGYSGSSMYSSYSGWSDGNSSTTLNNCYTACKLTEGTGTSSTFTLTHSGGTNTFNNCYYLNEMGTVQGTPITAEQKANGTLCYKLNGDQSDIIWYQTLGTDAQPVPFSTHARVYGSGVLHCDGSDVDLTYSNTESYPTQAPHEYEDGLCKNCGVIETDADGYKKIINAQTLTAFTVLVNANGETNAKARMYADVDMSGITDYYPIGTDAHLYVGEFDGQGHVVKNLVINNGGYDYQGLFGRIGGGANIKNLVLDKTCSITGNAFVGLIGGTNGGGEVYITNIGNEGTITSNAQNAAGILGVDNGGSANLHITNCYVTGAINGNRESATICGWSSSSSVVKNCWSSATLTGIYGTGSFTRGSTQIVNCYELEGVGQQDNVNKVTAKQVTSGAFCYLLNGNTNDGETWTQTIAPGSHPVLFGFGQTVHQASSSSFTNLPVVDGKLPIANGETLKKFADEVNAGNTTSDAVLTAEIDYTAYPKGFIGTDGNRYSGTFDGQMYTVTTDIKNNARGTGLFGSIIDATIRNLVLEGSVESSEKWIGGIGGISRGDNTLIENVVVKSTVKFTGTDDSTCGGLFGDMEGAFTVKNCAFVGSINVGEGLNVGGLVSWTGSGTFTNCLVAPAEIIAGSQKDFVHGGAGTCSNCIKVESTDARLASGELCYLLNGSTQGGTDWYQNLDVDAYPVPFSTHSFVYQFAVTDAGYATFVPKANVAALPAGVTAYAAQKNPTYIHLEEVTEVPADNAVVVKAAEGTYYYNNTDEVRILGVANDLTFSNDAVETDGTQYILANKGGVGFYKAIGTIPAGKGYLVIDGGALVKTFYPFEGDDADGINEVNGQCSMVDGQSIYNLAGQRINKAQKGVNIVNGKKILF